MKGPLESVLSYQLRSQSDLSGKLSVAAGALEILGSRFDATTVEVLAAALQKSAGAALDWAEQHPKNVNSAYLCALLSEHSGDPKVCTYWERFLSLSANRDPFHRLAYARALSTNARRMDAARQIQLALAQPVRYAFFPRAEKLVEQIVGESGRAESEWPESGWPLRKARVAVLGTSTTSLLIPVLKALCLRDRIHAVFYQGLYGAVQQEVLDPDSGLAKFRPDLVFLVTHWRDLNLPPMTSDEDAAIERLVEENKLLWQRLSDQFGCHVVQHAYDFPAAEAYGYLAGSLAGGRSRMIQAVNLAMQREAPSHVSILDAPAIQRQTGLDRWEDATLWHSFKQHPGTDALPALAEMQQAHLRAVLGLTRKVLVVDLDNTLWKGIIGEDGLEGIQIGPGSAAGEAHQRLQEYMRDLRSRGILLAVCSKNNLEDARLPFEKHEHMLLRLEDFAAFQANWNDKAQNLREIAEKLSLGLDSFVFLDDNPMEREWVGSQLPQVTVPDVGSSVVNWVRDLDRAMYFFTLSLSKEDLARAEQYRSEAQREMLRSTSQSLDEFLVQMQLEASMVPVSDANLARVTQLVNKTNQFNVTTRRYTEAQVRQLAQRPRSWTAAFHLSDRVGAYGLIGVLFCIAAGPDEWEIDTWLMSCRVLGRQMEHFMFDRMFEAAAALGIRKVTGIYRPTAKNSLVEGLYPKLGFSKASETTDEIRYEIAVPESPATTATHIRNVSAPAVMAGAD
jgi:FkbH-like protein